MAKMKSTKKYYFSVEGETEQWYLKWLQDRINETEEAKIKVSFDYSNIKDINTTGKIRHLQYGK